jgi:hypothetical protein
MDTPRKRGQCTDTGRESSITEPSEDQMSWIDFVLIVIIIAAVAIQSKRGFLQSCFDFVAGLMAFGITRSTCGKMPEWTPLVAFGAIFVVLMAVSYWLYNLTAFTLETYDPVLGAMFGFALACVIGFVIYWTGDPTRFNPAGQRPEWMLDSRLTATFYDYTWWRGFLDFMAKLGTTD